MKYINKISGQKLTIDIETPGVIIINDKIYPEADIPKHTWVNPCEYCPNNPMVNKFASGVCNCTLPYLCNPIY